MEVHKHPHHITHKKKWGEYLLEFVILFLAVFLGFMAENFREHNVERSKEREYMHSIVADLREDTTIINRSIMYNNGVSVSDSSLLFLLQSPLRDSFTITQIFKYFSKSSNFWVEFNESKTFEQLESTGDMRVIRNKPVLDSMAKYYQIVAREKIFRDEIQAQLQLTYNLADKIFDVYAFEGNLRQPANLVTNDTLLIKEYSNKLNHLIKSYKEYMRHLSMVKITAVNFMSVINNEYHLDNE